MDFKCFGQSKITDIFAMQWHINLVLIIVTVQQNCD